MKSNKLTKESKAKKNETPKKTRKVTEETISLTIEELSEVNGGEARQQGLIVAEY